MYERVISVGGSRLFGNFRMRSSSAAGSSSLRRVITECRADDVVIERWFFGRCCCCYCALEVLGNKAGRICMWNAGFMAILRRGALLGLGKCRVIDNTFSWAVLGFLLGALDGG